MGTWSRSVGVPIDLTLRVHLGRVYLQFMGGPWIDFAHAGFLRPHGGVGFGIQKKWFSAGLEVGWLSGSPSMGIRLALII